MPALATAARRSRFISRGLSAQFARSPELRQPPRGVYAKWRIRQFGTRIACEEGMPNSLMGEMHRMPKKRRARRVPISRALRKTIYERDLSAYAAAKQAGVSVDAVQRFLKAERGLTLATVDKLADALELTLCPDDPPAGHGTA